MNTIKFLKMDDAQLQKEIEAQNKKIKAAKDTIAVLERFRIAENAKTQKPQQPQQQQQHNQQQTHPQNV